MSTVIEGFISGDDLDLERDVLDVTITDPLVKAWLTIKTAPNVADPGTLQKVITTSQVAGTGHITQDGSVGNGDGVASLRFELTKTDTATLGHAIRYFYDVQVKTAGGKIKTPDKGTIQFLAGVTDATT